MKCPALVMISFVAILSGCQTAGALRVNVEVYKGPLIDETQIQKEKLIGLLTDIPQAGLSLVNDIIPNNPQFRISTSYSLINVIKNFNLIRIKTKNKAFRKFKIIIY